MIRRIPKGEPGKPAPETIIAAMKDHVRSLELMGWPPLNRRRQPPVLGEGMPGIIHVDRRRATVFIRKKPDPEKVADPYADE